MQSRLRRSRRGAGDAPKPDQAGQAKRRSGKENNGTPVGPAEKPSGEAAKEAKTEPKPEVAMAQTKDGRRPLRPNRSPRKSRGPSSESGATEHQHACRAPTPLTISPARSWQRVRALRWSRLTDRQASASGSMESWHRPRLPRRPRSRQANRRQADRPGKQPGRKDRRESRRRQRGASRFPRSTIRRLMRRWDAAQTNPGEKVPHRPSPGRKRDRRESRVRRRCEPFSSSRLASGA